MMYIILKLLPHLVVLISLFDLLVSSARDFLNLVFSGLGILAILALDPLGGISKLIMFPLIIITITIPSPITFSLVFVIRSLSAMGIDLGFASRFIPILLMLSTLDVISKHYRKGQEAYVKYSKLWSSIPFLVFFVIPPILLPLAVQGYIGALINALVNAARRTLISGLLSINPLFLIAVAAIVGIVIYKSMSSILEIVVVFLAKPREYAMDKLKNTEDIDVWLRLPLSSIRSLLLAMIFAPPIYYVSTLVIKLSPWITSSIASWLEVSVEVTKLILEALVLFIVSAIVWKVIDKTFKGPEFNSKTVLILSLASLVSLYLLGVYNTINATGFSLDIFLRPDLEGAARVIRETYISYFTTIFLILELLLKIFGVAP
ncbi:MAG: hypothetical protein QXZ41_07965 [Ignisphaera sp.]